MTTRPSSLAKRRAVLAAAEGAFLRGGYALVTMDEIAERSGVAKQTVYAYFGSKEALFVELVTSMTREAGDPVYADHPAIESREDLTRTLEHTLGSQLDIVLMPRLLQLRRLVIGEVPRFPALARALAEHGPQRAIAAIAVLLTEVSDHGLIVVPDPRAAAAQLNWLVMGGPLNDAMLLGDDALPPAGKRRAHVRRAVATFLAAY
jgi:TetR/AcrR family transcriptional regulator, mexJK operon transcriptional repressor